MIRNPRNLTSHIWHLIRHIIAGIISFVFIVSCNNNQYPYFWKAGVNGAQVFFLGTLHKLSEEDSQEIYPLSRDIYKTLDTAQTIMFEVDDGPKGIKEQEIIKLVSFKNNQTLEDHFSEEDLKIFFQKYYEFGGNRSFQNKMKRYMPFPAAIVLSELQSYHYGLKYEFGIESHIKSKLTKKISIVFLENTNTTIKQFTMIPLKIQKKYFLLSLKESNDEFLSKSKKLFKSFINGTLHNHIKEQNEIDSKELKEYFEYELEINRTRNRAWFNKILEIVEPHKTYFVVVGAGHFFGEGNLLELLRKKGYKVEKYWK